MFVRLVQFNLMEEFYNDFFSFAYFLNAGLLWLRILISIFDICCYYQINKYKNNTIPYIEASV
jgi:hypothetical protein